MDVKADALILEGIDEFRRHAGQVNAQALHSIVEIRVHCFDHGTAAAIKNVNCGDTPGFDVVEESAVTHASHSGISRRGGGTASEIATAQDLDTQKSHHNKGQEPESKDAPALVQS